MIGVYSVLAAGLSSLLLLMALRYLKNRAAKSGRLPLPPGPLPLPIIGNLLDFPQNQPWKTYHAMSQRYGDIVYLNVLGQPIIILGSATAVSDLLEKRSSNYSDRLRLTMLSELMGFHYVMSLMGYGEWWRRHRRRFHQYFNAKASENYLLVQAQQSLRLIKRLRYSPERFYGHVRHILAATIMKVTYDIDVAEENDEFVGLVTEALVGFTQAGIWGAFFVDILPILKYLPTWFPGAKFQAFAAHYRKLSVEMKRRPYEAVKQRLQAGKAGPSVTAGMIEALPTGSSREEEEEINMNSLAIAFGAGADTTTSAAQLFFLAMAMYPEIQARAQAQLDTVVGENRLPEFSDRPLLPYIEAIVKETLRWQLVTPLAVPHFSSDEDEYRGYYIPRGAVVIGNAWSLMHDPVEFPDPEEFRPERFLTPEGKLNPKIRDPESAAFGFGRRICPGRHMSINSLFSIISNVLHVYDIQRGVNKDGNPMCLEARMTTGVISYPEPFDCKITPRSAAAEALILASTRELL